MRVRPFCGCIAIAALWALAAGCPDRAGAPGGARGDRPAEGLPLEQERMTRDEAFRTRADSPIPEPDRGSFPGLRYYPVDGGLRFSVRLHRHPQPENVRLATSTGEIVGGLRYGYFEFAVDGQSCRLEVFRLDTDASGGNPSLFIPFRDATSGVETYGSGRYLDLEENTSGTYDLDFNRAYNPYCAYNPLYSCPLPPPENTLAVAIRAGEKTYAPSGGARQ